jgi:hypothetical protein
MLMLEDHPYRPLPHLGGVPRCLVHDPDLFRVAASGDPGAVHQRRERHAGVFRVAAYLVDRQLAAA